MVLNATFNNISAISWQSVLMVEEIGVPGEVTLSCGPFQIKKDYWIDCGRPGYSKL
jgi:hypothetical protein